MNTDHNILKNHSVAQVSWSVNGAEKKEINWRVVYFEIFANYTSFSIIYDIYALILKELVYNKETTDAVY